MQGCCRGVKIILGDRGVLEAVYLRYHFKPLAISCFLQYAYNPDAVICAKYFYIYLKYCTVLYRTVFLVYKLIRFLAREGMTGIEIRIKLTAHANNVFNRVPYVHTQQ